jgi:hypothetical protein
MRRTLASAAICALALPLGCSLVQQVHELVAGKPPVGLTIPARGTSEVTLPATVDFKQLGQSLVARLRACGAQGPAQLGDRFPALRDRSPGRSGELHRLGRR